MDDNKLVIDSDKFLYTLLDTIRENCYRRETCKGCMLDDVDGGCCVASYPAHWETNIIRSNLEKRTESEGSDHGQK